MICRDCQELFSRVWERDLPTETKREAEAHLAACGACRRSYAAFRSAQTALSAHAPAGPRVSESFTREVMRQVRLEAAAGSGRTLRLRRWLPLAAAAALLATAGLGIVRGWLPVLPAPEASQEGFSVYHAYTSVAEPYRPGDPLLPGDVVVARRGGSIPVDGRLVNLGPDSIAWIPGGAAAPAAPEADGRIVFATISDNRVQVLSGGGPGIAWRQRPSDRRHYLYQLVDLAESEDLQASALAREELSRVLGPAAGGSGLAEPASWRLALDQTDEGGWHDDAVVFPFERSVLALGGPAQDDHLRSVSHAVLRTLGLVGDRWMPGPVNRVLKGLPREGS